jgi:hypothetical protein
VNREAAVVAAPQTGRSWDGVVLGLREQLAVASGEAQRLRRQLEAMGYETPLTSQAEKDQRRELGLHLSHYEQIARDLARELRHTRKEAAHVC